MGANFSGLPAPLQREIGRWLLERPDFSLRQLSGLLCGLVDLSFDFQRQPSAQRRVLDLFLRYFNQSADPPAALFPQQPPTAEDRRPRDDELCPQTGKQLFLNVLAALSESGLFLNATENAIYSLYFGVPTAELLRTIVYTVRQYDALLEAVEWNVVTHALYLMGIDWRALPPEDARLFAQAAQRFHRDISLTNRLRPLIHGELPPSSLELRDTSFSSVLFFSLLLSCRTRDTRGAGDHRATGPRDRPPAAQPAPARRRRDSDADPDQRQRQRAGRSRKRADCARRGAEGNRVRRRNFVRDRQKGFGWKSIKTNEQNKIKQK